MEKEKFSCNQMLFQRLTNGTSQRYKNSFLMLKFQQFLITADNVPDRLLTSPFPLVFGKKKPAVFLPDRTGKGVVHQKGQLPESQGHFPT